MKWGVIGTGNMGEILIDSWLSSKMISQNQLYITNRTIAKAYHIQERYPNIQVYQDKKQLIEEVDIIYICVKPLEIYPLLTEFKASFRETQCLVSITSPYSVENLQSLVPCQVARLIPSITNRALAGVTLVSFGDRITKEMKGYLLQSIRLYSTPQEIENHVTRMASDLVSCGPAFFGYLAQQYMSTAVRLTDMDESLATQLTEKMFIGFGKLLEDGHFTLPELIEKVCVKGGVTGEGINSMENELGALFPQLVKATHNKYQEDIRKISKQLN